jgi:hypothetical protein
MLSELLKHGALRGFTLGADSLVESLRKLETRAWAAPCASGSQISSFFITEKQGGVWSTAFGAPVPRSVVFPAHPHLLT